MPNVKDSISKFEKTAAEPEAPAHGKKIVKKAPEAEARVKTNQATPENPIAKRSGRALPTPPKKGRPLPTLPSGGPSAKERKGHEILEREEALKEAFIDSPGATNPIMEAIYKMAPKKVFESIKTMMTAVDPEAHTKIDENTFGTTAKAFFGKNYKDLSPIQKAFVEKHNGEEAFDVMAAAKAVIEEIKSDSRFLDYNVLNCITRGGSDKDTLDQAIIVLDFKQSVKKNVTNLGDAFQAWQVMTYNVTKAELFIHLDPNKIRREIKSSDPHLTMIPPQVFELEYLYSIYLESTQVSDLTADIKNLSKLETLTLIDLPMQTIPPEIGHLPNLKTLTIDECALNHLPPEIGQLSNLSKLVLTNLQLTELPDTIGNLRGLKELDVSHNNGLEFLPITFSNLLWLKELNIFSTNIYLPPEIGSLKFLEELHLNSNRLPDSIVNLKNLKFLSYSIRWSELTPEQQDWIHTLRDNGCKIRQFDGIS